MFSDFPSLHPLVVHFPVVLILLSVLFQAVVTVKNWQQIRWATLFLMGAAFISALAASTIFHAMPSDDAPKAAMEIYKVHDKFAQYTIWMSGITLLLKTIGDFFKIHYRAYDVLVLVAAILAAIFLSITGHHGARLVHVAGVGPMGRYLMEDHHAKRDSPNMRNNMSGAEEHDSSEMPDNHSMSKKDSMKDMEGMQSMEDPKNNGNGEKRATHDMPMEQDMKQMDKPSMEMKDDSPMDAYKFKDNNPALKTREKKGQ